MTNGVSKMSDGGQAFPSATGGGDFGLRPVAGMTLRDYFAGQASEEDVKKYVMGYAVSSNPYSFGENVLVPKYSREQARYRFADAMLAARNEDQE